MGNSLKTRPVAGAQLHTVNLSTNLTEVGNLTDPYMGLWCQLTELSAQLKGMREDRAAST